MPSGIFIIKYGRIMINLIQASRYVLLPRASGQRLAGQRCCHSASPASTSGTDMPPAPPAQQFPLTTIMEKIAALNNPIIYTNMANIKDVGQYLFSKNIPLEKMIELFSTNPDLCQYPRRNWETVVDFLIGNEVPNKVIYRVLITVPQVLDKSSDDLDLSFECLRRRGFDNRAICQVFYQAPVLLAVEAVKVNRQIEHLMTAFTRKDLLKLIPKCTNVLTEEWRDLEAKLRYIVHVMGIEQPEIKSSMALSHTLHHIRVRHQLLYRAGLYKKVRPKKKVDNPKLTVITDTPTRELVEKVVGINMNEFFVFEKLLLAEGPEHGFELEHDMLLTAGYNDGEEDSDSEANEGAAGYVKKGHNLQNDSK